MDLFHALVLAIVQGITEFFPVSSSAHLILVPEILGWPDQGVDFDLGVHVGTLVAVVLWFRHELTAMIPGFFAQLRGEDNANGRLALNLVIATIPVLFIGFILKDWIEATLRSPLIIAAATLVFGIVLWLSARRSGVRTIDQLTTVDAITIGFAQVLALIPGTSRSGITMSAASMLGFKIDDAAKFSFLLSIPTIALPGAYLAYKLISNGVAVGWLPVLVGAVVSAVAAWIGIGFCLRVLARLGYTPFVIYRIALALYLVWVFY